MNDLLADTHAIVWHLADQTKLSAPALAALQRAEQTGRIYVSAITFIELTYLVERWKIPQPVLTTLWEVVDDPTEPIEVLPLTTDVARLFDQIPRVVVPDMPDRIISATALTHRLPLVSADQRIRSLTVSGLTVIW